MDYKNELLLAQRAAELYPKNYYAWNYRHWIVSLIPHNSYNLLEDELQNMKQWVQRNVSDYSGIQHRQRCLTLLTRHLFNSKKNDDLCGISRNDLWDRRTDDICVPCENSKGIVQVWRDEVLFTRDLILSYPGH